jgi:hypothetical protein
MSLRIYNFSQAVVMSRRAVPLVLEDSQRLALRELERADSTPQALAFRARLILRYEVRKRSHAEFCCFYETWASSAAKRI